MVFVSMVVLTGIAIAQGVGEITTDSAEDLIINSSGTDIYVVKPLECDSTLTVDGELTVNNNITLDNMVSWSSGDYLYLDHPTYSSTEVQFRVEPDHPNSYSQLRLEAPSGQRTIISHYNITHTSCNGCTVIQNNDVTNGVIQLWANNQANNPWEFGYSQTCLGETVAGASRNLMCAEHDVRIASDSGIYLVPLTNNPNSVGVVALNETGWVNFRCTSDSQCNLGRSDRKWATVYRDAEASDWFIGRDFNHIYIKDGVRQTYVATYEDLITADIIEYCDYEDLMASTTFTENMDCTKDDWKYVEGKGINDVEIYMEANPSYVDEELNAVLVHDGVYTGSKAKNKIGKRERKNKLKTVGESIQKGRINHNLVDGRYNKNFKGDTYTNLQQIALDNVELLTDLVETLCTYNGKRFKDNTILDLDSYCGG